MGNKKKRVGYVKPYKPQPLEDDRVEPYNEDDVEKPTRPNKYTLDDEPIVPAGTIILPKNRDDNITEDEDPINPGDEPVGDPLGGYKIEFDEAIKGQELKIQCTWANAFTEPVWDRGLCIRSFDKNVFAKAKITDNVIGTTTGYYHVTDENVVWLEATLRYTNRRSVGWFRESDVWHPKKGTIDPNPGDDNKKKKINWLTWLVTGASILKIVS